MKDDRIYIRITKELKQRIRDYVIEHHSDESMSGWITRVIENIILVRRLK